MAVLFVDIDHFKGINDTFGHRIGDLVLRTVAQRMKRALRSSDTLARISGDEFVVVCEDLTDAVSPLRAVDRLADRLRTAVSAPIGFDGVGDGAASVAVTVSVGAALSRGGVDTADLLHQADLAMYAAKTRGSNTNVIVPAADAPTDTLEASRRLLSPDLES
ncbi:GGDEF domain-containing protein [Nakamurella leprariae]|uniref:GGDEF domain-containing protein n=1 Tax=Nakamurella leprariae TaxID=2803911 RepID=A0A938Y404_9ACTN|nr:GGDEF domain-containing protein [Nakamurella leprariae]MBM9465661.1 GGDEF domain-containing protein [Nakamurella leprariae]